MLVVLSLFGLLALSSAQTPKPCESPKEWTGRLLQVDHSKNFSVFGKISYDEENQRVRILEDIDISGKRSFYDYIILYRESLLYRIKLSINRTGECTVSEFHEPFRPSQIPSDAKFAVEAYIGGSYPGIGVLVNTFYGEMEHKENKVYYVATVTKLGCIPVHSVAYSKEIGAVHSSFYDVMLGTDPEHFIPPPGCKQAKLPETVPRF